jgi:membrane associated rhomboid family serine protease
MSVTIVIVIITVIFSWQGFENVSLKERFLHCPYIEFRHKEYYRWITSGFLHADIGHLAINMFVFYQFGGLVEKIYQAHFGQVGGSILYLLMYLTSIVCGDLFTFAKEKDNPHYRALGASGGVSGIMFAFILFNPWAIIELYFILPLPIILWGVLYLAYEQWASTNKNDNIGHDAHFFGAVAGMIVTIVLEPTIYTDFIFKLLHESPYW